MVEVLLVRDSNHQCEPDSFITTAHLSYANADVTQVFQSISTMIRQRHAKISLVLFSFALNLKFNLLSFHQDKHSQTYFTTGPHHSIRRESRERHGIHTAARNDFRLARRHRIVSRDDWYLEQNVWRSLDYHLWRIHLKSNEQALSSSYQSVCP